MQNHLHQWILLMVFLDMEFLKATADTGWGLGFIYIISSLPLKETLFFLLLHFIYI